MRFTDTDWWLIVQDVPPGSSPASWLVGWLPVGHRHVWALREEQPGWWLIVDAMATRMRCEVEWVGEATADEIIAGQVAKGRTAIRVRRTVDESKPWVRGWLTCVSVVKGLCGIRAWWVLTPAQLIRWAEARGCEVRR